MKLRSIALLAVVAMVACGGAAPEDEIEVVEEVPMDDAAAIEAMIDEFALHFNLVNAKGAKDPTVGVRRDLDNNEVGRVRPVLDVQK